MKIKKVHAIQCSECLRCLGVSWDEITCVIKCFKCAEGEDVKSTLCEECNEKIGLQKFRTPRGKMICSKCYQDNYYDPEDTKEETKSGVTITDVKVVGMCSKCRKEGDDIPKYTDGKIVPDEDISCLNKAFDKCLQDRQHAPGGKE